MKFIWLLLLSVLYAVESIELNGNELKYDGIQYVMQKPAQNPPIGVVFFAHGCSHSGTDWWPKSESCPHCIGLSIESSFVEEGLKRGYLVIAQSSLDRDYKCWEGADVALVVTLIKHIYATHLNNDLNIPLHLWGGSSGGAFVGALAHAKVTVPSVSSVSVQIFALKNYDQIPPTLFVMMEKDPDSLDEIAIGLESLMGSEKAKHKLLKATEGKITKDYFYVHGKALSLEDSVTLQKAFIEHGIISRGSLLLKDDPRRVFKWRKVALEALPHVIPAKDTLLSDRSSLSEIMNMAYCMHEITDQYLKETFDWYDVHKKPL